MAELDIDTILATNFYVDHELGPDEGSPTTILCDSCEENDRQNATHTCQECRQSMCPSCRRNHDKFTRDHHVTSVGLGQPAREQRGQRGGKERGLCLVHQDQALCFHCRQCDVSICVHCRLTSHEGHDTFDLNRAALQAREELRSLIPTAQQQLQAMEISIQRANRQDQELTRHAQEVTQQIHTHCDQLVTWARRSRDRLVDEASASEDSARSRLHGEKASDELTRDTLSTLIARAARASLADPDTLMTCRKELKVTLLSGDELERRSNRPRQQRGRGVWEHDVTDASVLQEDDVRAYMGRVVAKEEEGDEVVISGAPYVSLRELAGRVERLTQEVTENTNILASQIRSCTDHVTQCQNDVTKLQKQTQELGKTGDELKKTGDELQKKIDEQRKKGVELERKTKDLKKKTDSQQTGDEMPKKLDEMEKRAERLEKNTAALEHELAASKRTGADLQKITEAVLQKLGTDTLMFSARGMNKAKTEQSGAMVFSDVKVNVGGHLNDQTGVFTAPKAGLYSFTATVASDNLGLPVHGKITVDGVSHCTFMGSSQEGSGRVLVQLAQGQMVWVMPALGQSHKRTAINMFVTDNNIDVMLPGCTPQATRPN